MRHHADLFFDLDPARADALARALSPETDRSEVPKTRASVRVEPGGLRVAIEADDLSAMRAALNSWLRWVDAAQKAAHIGRP